jgi:hypothetical protein
MCGDIIVLWDMRKSWICSIQINLDTTHHDSRYHSRNSEEYLQPDLTPVHRIFLAALPVVDGKQLLLHNPQGFRRGERSAAQELGSESLWM